MTLPLSTSLDPRPVRRTSTAKGALTAFLLLAAALAPIAAVQAQETERRGSPQGGREFAPATRQDATTPGGRAGFGGGTGMGTRGPQVPLAPGSGPACALDATIYDVRLPADQIGRLDPDALTKASATPAAFEKALAELGTARPLYRASQSVRLAGDSITIGTNMPYITNSRLTDTGQTVNTVQYSSLGAIFSIAGKAASTGNIELDLSIQLSALSDSATTISTTVKAPMFRSATMSHKGMVEARRPFVVMSVDASSLDADGKAVAYIARVTLGVPQSTPARAGE